MGRLQRSFEMVNGNFVQDGRAVQILSGSVHYWRTPAAYWEHRLGMMRDMGLNTVETYVPWFLHEPVPGQFTTAGNLDLVGFLSAAQRVGLNTILRPGPYICAEVDFGGLPSWLLRQPDLRIRSSHPGYLEAVRRYLDWLLPIVAPLQYSLGGSIIAVQIENEYGKFGNDRSYLEFLRTRMVEGGISELLFTCDYADRKELKAGALPGTLQTVNFGAHIGPPSEDALDLLRLAHRSNSAGSQPRNQDDAQPKMVTELWSGWFDYWGQPHARVGAQRVVEVVEQLLEAGASFNLYMFHGGSNFGFTSGAHARAREHAPFTTSYDYDAPLSEDGRPTAKFKALKKLLRRPGELDRRPPPESFVPPPAPARTAFKRVVLQEWLPMLTCESALPIAVDGISPLTMEMLPIARSGAFDLAGQRYGYILYRTTIPPGTARTVSLRLPPVHDRAQIFVRPVEVPAGASTDQSHAGILVHRGGAELTQRQRQARPFQQQLRHAVAVPEGGAVLDILVENMGRVGMGPMESMQEQKGLMGNVTLGGKKLEGWQMYPFELDPEYILGNLASSDCWRSTIQPADNKSAAQSVGIASQEPEVPTGGAPAFLRGTLIVDQVADTWVGVSGLRKGVLFANGFNLGRFWYKGPQQRIYLPGAVLRQGNNDIIVLEQEAIPPIGGLGRRAEEASANGSVVAYSLNFASSAQYSS